MHFEASFCLYSAVSHLIIDGLGVAGKCHENYRILQFTCATMKTFIFYFNKVIAFCGCRNSKVGVRLIDC